MLPISIKVERDSDGVIRTSCDVKDTPTDDIIAVLRHIIKTYDIEITMHIVQELRKRKQQ